MDFEVWEQEPCFISLQDSEHKPSFEARIDCSVRLKRLCLLVRHFSVSVMGQFYFLKAYCVN